MTLYIHESSSIRKIWLLIIIFFAVSLLLPKILFAQTSQEQINSFDATISVFQNGTAINETIVYDFGAVPRHGIYREIPLVSQNGPMLDIKVSSVSDTNGMAYRFSTSVSKDILNIKIGDPDILVSGVQTYVISYQILNTIRYFDDHDEFYWNITGNNWKVPIEKATASVWFQPFPKDSVLAAEFKSACFTGVIGSKEAECVSYVDSTNSDIFHFSTNSSLGAGEGLTIALSFPKELVNIVGSTNSLNNPASDDSSKYPIMGALFLVFIAVTFFVLKKIVSLVGYIANGRVSRVKIPKELKNKAIVTEYNPPADLFPVDIGTLFDRTVDMQDISSVILHLAIRGYLKINYITEKRRFWFSTTDFELIKIKEGNDLTHPADKIIFELLFDGRDSVTLSYLKTKTMTLQSDIGKIKEKVKDRLIYEKYFDSLSIEKSEKLKKYTKVIFAILIGIIFLSHFLQSFGIPEFLFYVLSGVGVVILMIVLALSFRSERLADRLSEKGISALEKILGFQEFLSMTEKERLDFHNAPEKNPEQFTEYLPYAMVLGIEKKWAQKFEGIYIPQPDWYQSNVMGSFVAVDFVSHMSIFSNSFIAMSVPKNTQSSGFGGGGSSGGGGGGGGGGSW